MPSRSKSPAITSVANRLREIYYDEGHPSSYGGVNRLAKAGNVSKLQAQKWLKSQRTYTIHRPARKRFRTRKYQVSHVDQQWQCDLCQLDSLANKNKGHHFILTAIDILSRYAWARPMKNKTPEETIKALESIFITDGRTPKYLQTDQGKEFENRKVAAFLKKYGVEQFSVKSPVKAAMVERFNRTLKTRMWRYFTHKGTQVWLDVLPKLVDGYNHSIHRSIKCAPADVNHENASEVWLHQFGNNKKPKRSKFKIGDVVRISKQKAVFDKGYIKNFSEEVFVINSVNMKVHPVMYQLRDLKGEILEGKFYNEELQSIDHKDEIYMIEKVLRKRKRGSRTELLVKWLGYPETSWIPEEDVVINK
jgi:transposase InsO family protein